ncbi:MAG: hypothetical protein GXX78_12715 [Bacteroidales bacterium]|nr:hypothetical protein [Bacteroidales bacterium]
MERIRCERMNFIPDRILNSVRSSRLRNHPTQVPTRQVRWTANQQTFPLFNTNSDRTFGGCQVLRCTKEAANLARPVGVKGGNGG